MSDIRELAHEQGCRKNIATDSDQKQLITDVARDLVVKVAPHELPLFPATSQAYFENPEKVLEKQKSEDTMLGFGLEAGAVFLTPAPTKSPFLVHDCYTL